MPVLLWLFETFTDNWVGSFGSHPQVPWDWMRREYLTEAGPDTLPQEFGIEMETTREIGQVVGKPGSIFPLCLHGEVKRPIWFYFLGGFLAPLPHFYGTVIWRQNASRDDFHFSLLDLLFTFFHPASFPRRLISILRFSVTPLPSGFHVGSVIMRYH